MMKTGQAMEVQGKGVQRVRWVVSTESLELERRVMRLSLCFCSTGCTALVSRGTRHLLYILLP